MPLGTIVNTITVMLGSIIGIMLKKKYPERIKAMVFQAIGLATLVIGITMVLQVKNILTIVFSLLIGGIVGELLLMEERFDALAERLQKRVNTSSKEFSEGLVTAFLIFCIGSMTIVGALDEGLRHDHSLLLTKSVLDGFTSAALASTYGIGVFFSAFPLLLFQGGITLIAAVSKNFFSPVMIAQLTVVGGAMIIGLGINLLGITRIKVLNLLPALVLIVLFTLIID